MICVGVDGAALEDRLGVSLGSRSHILLAEASHLGLDRDALLSQSINIESHYQ